MTLRFFRRKSSSEKTEEAPPDVPPADDSSADKPKTSSRRRSSTSRSRKTTSAAKKQEDSTEEPKKTSTSRTRRGRRGGAGRKSSSAAAKPTSASETEPDNITPLHSDGFAPGIEGVIARQEQMLEQQLAVLKGVQGTLSSIENRLSRSSAQTEQPRVAIFVDVPNVMYAAQRLRVTLDFKKMLDFLVRGRELVRASAYAPISDDPKERLETQRFVQPFVDHGYRVVTKPHKRYADGSMKANFDVELAIDVLTMSDRLDTVTLVSGDGDFRRLVELVASKGVRVEAVAFHQSMASELRAGVDEYIDLNDHLDELRAT